MKSIALEGRMMTERRAEDEEKSDLSRLPIVISRHGRRLRGLLMILAAIAVGLGLPLALIAAHEGPPDAWQFSYLALLPFASVLVVLWGLHDLRHRRDITITGEDAFFRERGLFSLRSWREPLSNYEGVTWRMRAPHRGKIGKPYVVELTHARKSRCLVLCTLAGEAEARRRCRTLAEGIGLPLIELPAPVFAPRGRSVFGAR
jgi:hypothetical protein